MDHKVQSCKELQELVEEDFTKEHQMTPVGDLKAIHDNVKLSKERKVPEPRDNRE